MRLFEFGVGNDLGDKFLTLLRTKLGKMSSTGSDGTLNYAGLNHLLGDELGMKIDYKTFDAIYKSSPMIKSMIKHYDDDGVEFDLPGAGQPATDVDKSKEKVNQAAASAAPQQLAKSAI